ncbi:MAG: tyrosine-type recombinase/integrase [Oscillospiraceae bacterium]|nr:tyrosine-type recombinase/integrase [Oscillospiraceae bacterium]
MENNKAKGTRKGNGEGSLYQRSSDGRWVAAIQDGVKTNGKPNMVYFTGKDEKKVDKKLKEYKKKTLLRESGMYVGASKIYVGEYINNWLNNIKSVELKPTSFDRLESTVRTNVMPLIGHISLQELTDEEIQKLMINKLYKDGLSHSSIKKAYDAINACCKYAVIRRDIVNNPCQLVKIPSQHKFEKTEARAFTDEEIELFKKIACSKYGNGRPVYPLGYGYIFMLNTGIRLGEALALKWKDIDFEKGNFLVSKNAVMAVDRSTDSSKRIFMEKSSPKTASGFRRIPLNKAALLSLNALKEIRYFGENSYVMSTADNTPNKQRNFSRTFDAMLVRAKIEPCGIHVLRHTFASKLFRAGIDVKTVSKLLGHSSTEVTYNTYIHLIQEQEVAAVKILDSI